MKRALPAFFLLSACAGAPSDGPVVIPTADATSTTTATPGPEGSLDFEVHEWGLLDVDGPSTAVRTLDVPAIERPPMNVKKPILYFHLGAGASRAVVDVSVTVPSEDGGRVVEHFPAGTVDAAGSSVRWSKVELRKGACGTRAPSKEPSGCDTPDGICEVWELEKYVTSDASCLEVAGQQVNHLFYRAREKTPTLPFEVTELAGGKLQIAHTKAADVIGPVVYVHDAPGASTVSVLAAPPLGASITADPPTTTDASSAARAIDAAMHEANLSDEEIAAFNRAWQGSLYGDTAPNKKMPVAPKTQPAPQDYLLFVVPLSLAEGISRISITPPPRALRRFLLVRLAV